MVQATAEEQQRRGLEEQIGDGRGGAELGTVWVLRGGPSMGMGSFVSGGDVEIWAMSDVGRGRRSFEAACDELVASTSTTCWQQRRQGVDGGLAASVRLTATWEFRLGFATSTTAACGLAGQSMVMAWVIKTTTG